MMNLYRILVIEDSKIQADSRERLIKGIFRELRTRLPDLADPEVYRAECISEAKRILTTVESKFDLIISDLALPETIGSTETPQYGLELLKYIKHNNSANQTVVFSVFKEFRNEVLYISELADEFIEKNSSEEKIFNKILSCIQEDLDNSNSIDLINSLRQTVIGNSPAMNKVFQSIARVIPVNASVLLLGETGTGKGKIARVIHEMGPFNNGEFVTVNLNSVTETLRERELFGSKQGAYSGSTKNLHGYIDKSNGGTLFLDEIGELGLNNQVMLLNILRDKVFRPIGDNQEKSLNTRLIFATNRDLREAVKTGAMRQDFFYRIAQVIIDIPPLREREDDIDQLATYFLEKFAVKHHRERKITISEETIEFLREQPWPGNVGELESVIEHAVIFCKVDTIEIRHVREAIRSKSHDIPLISENLTNAENKGLADLMTELKIEQEAVYLGEKSFKTAEKNIINAFVRVVFPVLLEQHSGNILKTARHLNMDPNTFRSKWNSAGLGPLRDDQ